MVVYVITLYIFGLQGIVCSHKNLAHSICYKIASKPEDVSVSLLTRMMLELELPVSESSQYQELIKQAELLLEVSIFCFILLTYLVLLAMFLQLKEMLFDYNEYPEISK